MVANKLQQLLLEPLPKSPSASSSKTTLNSEPKTMKSQVEGSIVLPAGKENATSQRQTKENDSFFVIEPTPEKKLQQNNGIQKFRLNLQKGFARAASSSRQRLAEVHRLSKQRNLQQQITKLQKKGGGSASESISGSGHTASSLDDSSQSTNNSSATEMVVRQKASSSSPLAIGPYKASSEKDRDTDSVSLAAKEWFVRVHALCHSEEMLAVQAQTAHLINVVGRASVQTALFPLLIFQQHQPLLLGNNRSIAHRNSTTVTTSARLFTKVVSVPFHAFQVLTQVTDQVAGDLMSLVIPVHVNERKRELHSLRKTQAERLRLDYHGDDEDIMSTETSHRARRCAPQQQTLYLMRVRDLGLKEEERESDPSESHSESSCGEGIIASGICRRVSYIDLSGNESASDTQLIRESMRRLVFLGVGMLADHPTVKLTNHKPYDSRYSKDLDWKCEGNTSRLLKRMHKESVLERLQTLQSGTLVWSGKFRPQSESNSQFSLYLARGIFPFSTREILHLLWDNNRTAEYNNFCLGRKTILDLSENNEESLTNDELLLSEKVHTGTKVIESETRVPFTSFTVKVQCLMHCQKLEGDTGYVIVSRSLHKGPAGTRFEGNSGKNDNSGIESSGNEILWGVNIIRHIPNHPHLADLTSLSQVGFSLGVPKFLASQIALKGVDEFFSNVRKLPTP